MASLLAGPLRVVNIGLPGFARDLAANGAAVAQVDWAPPRAASVAALARLSSHERQIEEANREALTRILSAEPVLTDPFIFNWKSNVPIGTHRLAARVTSTSNLTITSPEIVPRSSRI